MKIIGILCWYDEAPSWLAACVTSMIQHTEIDHLIALDGAYALLPDGRPFSGFEQHQVIDEICRASSVGLTLHAPREPWLNNEIEKRAFGFKLGESIAEIGEDWYFLMDADQMVTYGGGFRYLLENTDEDVGETWLFERFDPFANGNDGAITRQVEMPRAPRVAVRNVFRALPRLTVVDNHFTYITDGGAVLWNGGNTGSVPAIDTRCEIEHRTRLRDLARRQQQADYYRRRDEARAERTFEGRELTGVLQEA